MLVLGFSELHVG